MRQKNRDIYDSYRYDEYVEEAEISNEVRPI